MDFKVFRYKVIFFILASVSGILLFLLLNNAGPGVSPDSVYYLSVARNLTAGKGITGYDGYPLVIQPPLYPFLLFIMKIISPFNFLTLAGILNSILFGSIIYLSGLLFHKYTQSNILSIAGIFLIIFSSILLKIYLSALSEPLFIFFTLAYLYVIEAYLHNKKISTLILLSIITGAAVLTRYIGFIIIASGILTILFNDNKSKKKIYHLIIYAVLSAFPILLWMIRNYIVSVTLFGTRASSSFTIKQNISLAFSVISGWFEPALYYNGYLITAGLLISASFIFFYVKRNNNNTITPQLICLPVIIYTLIYILFLIISSSLLAYDKIDNRLLSPVFIPIIIIIVSITGKILSGSGISFWFNLKRLSAAACILALIFFFIQKSYFLIDDYLKNSGWEYNSSTWKHNSVVNFIDKLNDNNCCFYSNAPDAVYFFTKKETRWSPLKRYYNSPIRFKGKPVLDGINRDTRNYLVWFNNIKRPFLYSKSELKDIVHLKKITHFRDGEIYEIL